MNWFKKEEQEEKNTITLEMIFNGIFNGYYTTNVYLDDLYEITDITFDEILKYIDKNNISKDELLTNYTMRYNIVKELLNTPYRQKDYMKEYNKLYDELCAGGLIPSDLINHISIKDNLFVMNRFSNMLIFMKKI